MFKLLRYFSLSGLVVVLVAAALLGGVYRHVAVQSLVEMGEENCQGQPKFPQLWQSSFPHLVQESVVSSARTRPAFSFSLSRYELPRMFRVTA
jgi:hypothetical protein